MFKIAIKLLKSRKYISALFIIIVAFSIISLTLVDCSLSSIQNSILEKNKMKYGSHHGIFYDVSPKQIDNIDMHHISESGKIYLLGVGKVTQGDVTVGFFDEDALKMRELHLLEGHFPQNNNEIAVEKSQLKKFGSNAAIGSKVSIHLDNGEKFYTISGIIRDYSSYWGVSDYQTRGTNTLPEIITYPTSTKEINTVHTHFIFNYKFDMGVYDASKIRILGEDANIDMYSIVYNGMTYIEEYGIINILKIIRVVLLTSVLLVIFFTSAMLIDMYINKFSRTYMILYQCGASTQTVNKLKVFQFAIILIISLIVALIVSMVSLFLINKFMPLNFEYRLNLYYLLSVILAIAIIVFNSYKAVYCKDNNKIKANKIVKRIKPKRKRNLLSDIVLFGLSKNRGHQVKSALAIILLVSATFFSAVYIFDISDGDASELADFAVLGSSSEVSLEAGNYEVVQNNNQYITFDEADKTAGLAGVRTVYRKPFTVGNVLVIDNVKADTYWSSWSKYDSDYFGVGNYYNYRTRDKIVANEIEFYILTTEEAALLNKQYPEYKFSKLYDNNSIIIFAPKRMSKGNKLSGSNILDNATISIDRIEHKKNSDLAYPKADDTKYISNLIKSVQIIDEALDININGEVLQSEFPTIMMTENTAQKNNIMKGYSSIDINLDENINDHEYKTIENQLLELSAGHSDFYFFSLKDMMESERELISHILLSVLIFLIIMVTYVFLCFFAMSSANVRNNMYKIGVLRANGFSKRRIIKSIVLDSGLYLMIIFVMSAIAIIGELVILEAIVVREYAAIFILIFVGVGLISIIATLIASKPLYSTDVSHCIKQL